MAELDSRFDPRFQRGFAGRPADPAPLPEPNPNPNRTRNPNREPENLEPRTYFRSDARATRIWSACR